MKKIIIAAFCFSLVIASLFIVRSPELTVYRKVDFRLGTICAVQIVGVDNYEGWTVAEKCFQRIDELEMLFSVFEEESEIYKLNHAPVDEWVQINDETYVVLAEALYYAKESDGYFDITVFPLMKLWGFDEKEYRKPTESQIDFVRAAVGYEQVELELKEDRYHVRRLHENTMVDLGGIAKGYICDELVDLVKERGYSNFMINIGGNIFAAGYGPSGKGWKVGIRDPRDNSRTIGVVYLKNEAISTSGDYERYFIEDGRRYAHILNPKTGYPVEGVVAVTAVAETATLADIASTLLYVIPEVRRSKYFDRLRLRYARIIAERDGHLESSELGEGW